jgi:hypothetical protein
MERPELTGLRCSFAIARDMVEHFGKVRRDAAAILLSKVGPSAASTAQGVERHRDVSLTQTFGQNTLTEFTVWTNELALLTLSSFLMRYRKWGRQPLYM